MEIIKTICPRCFKIFDVSEEMDKIKCVFCEHMYGLPKFDALCKGERRDYIKRYYLNY